MKVRTYSELSKLRTFKERFLYLNLNGVVGKETFGFGRFLNQEFYRSSEWKSVRDLVILRDGGCDLGIAGYDVSGKIYIHHMNPILPKDIELNTEFLLNPEYLITTTHRTHNAIHYGDAAMLMSEPVKRSKNDTCPWRK